MSKLRDAAQQALEALEWADNALYEGTPIQTNTQSAITALRTALAEQPAGPDAEPVAWIDITDEGQIVSSPRIYPDGSREERPLYTAPQPAIPPGYKLVPEVPTNEWIHNLARRQTGSFEKAPFAEIHQCIAELLESAPEAPQPAKPAEQEPVAWCDQYESHIDGLRHYSDGGSREIPLYAAPQPRRRLTDEEIDNTTRKQVDDLLDHIYEYGTAAEGIDYRVRAIARAIEAAVWGDGK